VELLVCIGVPCGRSSEGFGGGVVGMDGNRVRGWLALPSSGPTKETVANQNILGPARPGPGMTLNWLEFH
jgi:hypothetical protein